MFKLGIAFVLGLSLALVPSFLAAKLFFRGRDRAPSAILRRFYAAQCLKWITTLLSFTLVFTCFPFEPYALFLGFVFAQVFFIKIVNKTNNNLKP
ncbi:MAG: ATP synthase subunit I [Gammaproteobacteria bacterium]|nr:ATP synthase subunit I [Gammaproteobacteria bacterium]MBP9728736.1 ATP synthase subunit I [Gammaproteobacteria bacterium]